jgi:hypothetical protein
VDRRVTTGREAMMGLEKSVGLVDAFWSQTSDSGKITAKYA